MIVSSILWSIWLVLCPGNVKPKALKKKVMSYLTFDENFLLIWTVNLDLPVITNTNLLQISLTISSSQIELAIQSIKPMLG